MYRQGMGLKKEEFQVCTAASCAGGGWLSVCSGKLHFWPCFTNSHPSQPLAHPCAVWCGLEQSQMQGKATNSACMSPWRGRTTAASTSSCRSALLVEEGAPGAGRAVPRRTGAAPAVLLTRLSFLAEHLGCGWDLDALHLSSGSLCQVTRRVCSSFPICVFIPAPRAPGTVTGLCLHCTPSWLLQMLFKTYLLLA